jgi:hypothetical protein
VDELAREIGVDRSKLDRTEESLDLIEMEVDRVGPSRFMTPMLMPMLVAYVGEVLRAGTNATWRMAFDENTGAWEPLIVGSEGRTYQPFALAYTELLRGRRAHSAEQSTARLAHIVCHESRMYSGLQTRSGASTHETMPSFRSGVERSVHIGRLQNQQTSFVAVRRAGLDVSASRRFVHAEKPPTAPSDRTEPRFRLRNDDPPRHRPMKSRPSTWKTAALSEPSPPLEAHRRRKRVDSHSERFRRVLSKIREHVDERSPHLARRAERTAMPAIRPKPTAAQDERIHRARNANGHALHAARQSPLVTRFDNKVHMVPLHGKVHDSETLWLAPSGASQSDAHARKNILTA